MPLAILQEKLETINESYYDLISDFFDFIRYRQQKEQNGLDEAIEEVKNGKTEYFKTFEDFKAAMSKWSMIVRELEYKDAIVVVKNFDEL